MHKGAEAVIAGTTANRRFMRLWKNDAGKAVESVKSDGAHVRGAPSSSCFQLL